MHNALRSLGLGQFATTATTGTIGMLFMLLVSATALAGPAEVDDGWRRTRFGWENIKHWDLTPEQRELPSATPLPSVVVGTSESPTILLHPGILAIALSMLAIAALCFTTPWEHACSGSVSIDLSQGSAV